MARYKPIDTGPRFLAVDLQRQLLPGTFEFAVDWLVEHQLDRSGFDARYRNDFSGASAYGVTRQVAPAERSLPEAKAGKKQIVMRFTHSNDMSRNA